MQRNVHEYMEIASLEFTIEIIVLLVINIILANYYDFDKQAVIGEYDVFIFKLTLNMLTFNTDNIKSTLYKIHNKYLEMIELISCSTKYVYSVTLIGVLVTLFDNERKISHRELLDVLESHVRDSL